MDADLHGRVLRQATFADLRLTETAYTAGLRLATHEHVHPYLSIVLRGAYVEAFGQHERTCNAATLLFHTAAEAHRDLFHTNARCFNVQFGPAWYESVASLRAGAIPASMRQLIARAYLELRNLDDCSAMIVEGLVLELLGLLQRERAAQHRPRWLEEARERICADFSQRLTVEHLARCAGVHPVHFARSFQKHFHCSPGEFLRQRRLDYACNELQAGQRSLADIAITAGFSSQSHFSTTFKRYIGVTPAVYRRRCTSAKVLRS